MSKKNHNRGFTLIELMVSVSIFAIVTLIVSGSFITLASIYRQVQADRAIINNLNLAMDTMTLQIREGEGHDIENNNKISFQEYIIVDGNYIPGDYFIYKLDTRSGDRGVLQQCVDDEINCNDLTSEEIDVDQLYFENIASDNKPRLIRVVMKGIAINNKGIESPFLLQTTLSQRNLD